MPLATLLFLAAVQSPAELPPVAADALRVFLVRHGQALSNLEPKPDLPADKLDHLTDLGREQAQRAARSLAGQGSFALISSPAGRAQETAREMRTVLGTALRTEPALRPMEAGRSAAGKTLAWSERSAEWKAGRDPAPPDGESIEQVAERVLGLVQNLQRGGGGRSVVLVAHGEVLGAFLGLLQGKPAPQRYPWNLENGSISVVEAHAEGRPTVVFVNHVPAEVAAPAR